MSDANKIGSPKQDVYTIEEVVELFQNGEFTRGAFVIDSDGKGTFKISRLQKQWVQKPA